MLAYCVCIVAGLFNGLLLRLLSADRTLLQGLSFFSDEMDTIAPSLPTARSGSNNEEVTEARLRFVKQTGESQLHSSKPNELEILFVEQSLYSPIHFTYRLVRLSPTPSMKRSKGMGEKI